MKEDKFNKLLDKLQGSFDTEEPFAGHQQRFLQKLESSKDIAATTTKKISWWKPLSIAASIALLIAVGFNTFSNQPSIEEQVAEISPEISNTQFYFASLIEEQVKELESESTPETKEIISDTMIQLKQLEASYMNLEQELIKGGNSKFILSAMIRNFQTRIALLQDVLDQIETIKTIKEFSNENNII